MATISVPVLDRSGGEVGTYEFESERLAKTPNKQLLHDAVVMYLRNRRVGTVRTRSRGMVAGSTKKMFKQKGTGRARMGPKRSPIRKGGGVTFGLSPRDWTIRMPKKALRAATRQAVLSKFQDDEVTLLDEFTCTEPKTKPVAESFAKLGLAERGCLLVTAELDPMVLKSARNLANVWVRRADDLNAYDVLHQRQFVTTRAAMDRLLDRTA